MTTLSARDRKIIAAVQDGLPLESRPYAVIGQRIGMTEHEVLEHVAALQNNGAIKRSGVIVRHHELGFCANAMVTWDVADDKVAELGQRIAKFECVTLCYRRARHLPEWPYNLYCMIHGQDRSAVLEQIEHITTTCGLKNIPQQILFSQRRFKQRGARYVNRQSIPSSLPRQQTAAQA
ncbi:AsnC family protein [Pseudomonadota bacterium]